MLRKAFALERTSVSHLESFLTATSRYHVPTLLGASLSVMIVHLLTSDALILGWRPTDLTSIALNYYRNGFDFLYPQVHWGGNGPGYVEMEFPIIPFLTAVLFKIFGVHEWVAVVIPLLTGLGMVVAVFLLAQHLFGHAAAFVAGLTVAVSPTLAALTTSLWPDPPMVLFGTLGLYFLLRWTEDERLSFFLLAGIAISLSILLKLPALYLGFPILYMFVIKYGVDVWRKPSVWFFGLLVLSPPILWYMHAHTLYQEYHNTFGIITGGYSKFGNGEILGDPSFYLRTVARLALYHATPFMFLCFFLGIPSLKRTRFPFLFQAWLGAVAVYFLIAARGVLEGHYQYVLPILPPVAIVGGIGVMRLAEKIETLRFFKTMKLGIYFSLMLLCVVSVAIGTTLFLTHDQHTTQMWKGDMKTGIALGKVTPPGSLIVVVDNYMDAYTPETSMTPPMIFYFSDRHGWYVSMSWLNESVIERLRTQGAQFLAVSSNAVTKFKSYSGTMENYLATHYQRRYDGNDGLIYDMTLSASGISK